MGPSTLLESWSLDHALSEVDDLIDRQLTELAAVWPDPVFLTESDIKELWRHALLVGGKRVRPRMCYWGWVCAGGRQDQAGRTEMVTAAAALEMVHAFALIHDDVMDNADVRRSHPSIRKQAQTVHARSATVGDSARFGDSIAILVGDLGLAEAGHLASSLPAAMRREWRQMIVELVAGQGLDLTSCAVGSRDINVARRLARDKSGAYSISRPLRLGVLAHSAASGAEPGTLAVLDQFGTLLGEAYQLRDDVLGLWGDACTTGKPVGDDLAQGKATLLLALANGESGHMMDGVKAQNGLSDNDIASNDIASLLAALETSGARERVEQLITDLVEQAVDLLGDNRLDPDGMAGLAEFALRLANRTM